MWVNNLLNLKYNSECECYFQSRVPVFFQDRKREEQLCFISLVQFNLLYDKVGTIKRLLRSARGFSFFGKGKHLTIIEKPAEKCGGKWRTVWLRVIYEKGNSLGGALEIVFHKFNRTFRKQERMMLFSGNLLLHNKMESRELGNISTRAMYMYTLESRRYTVYRGHKIRLGCIPLLIPGPLVFR